MHSMRNVALALLVLLLLLAVTTELLAIPVIAVPAIIAAAAAGRALTRRSAEPAAESEIVPERSLSAAPVAVVTSLRAREQENRRAVEDGLHLVCDGVSARAAVLWRMDPDADLIRPIVAHGRALPAPRTLRGDPLAWVAREGTTMRIDPVPAWADANVLVIAARLWSHEDRGWIVTFELEPDHRPDLRTLDTICAPLRLLLELQDGQAETESVRRRMQLLLDLLHRIPVVTELEPAAHELISACLQLTGGTGGTVGMWDGDEGRIVTVFGTDGGPVKNATFTSPGSELALAVRAGGPLVRPIGAWKPGATQIANADDRWQLRVRTFAAIPLSTAHGATSVLAVWSTLDQPLDPAGLELVTAIAPYAALHLQHARDFGQLKETAETDALTGLRNRRAFDAAIQLESSRFERYGRPLALLMIDVDHFKAVNDQHGHEGGDQVLRRIAALVSTCVRDVDTAARFGGEELAILLPETTLAAAREVAERIRASIAASPVTWNSRQIPVTASIGVAGCPERVTDGAGLLAAADEALYEAKRTGRNRVIG